MIIEIIEKYWKDIMDEPVWEFLGIEQVTWCIEKKNKIPKKHRDKIYKHFGFDDDATESDVSAHIIKEYYECNKKHIK